MYDGVWGSNEFNQDSIEIPTQQHKIWRENPETTHFWKLLLRIRGFGIAPVKYWVLLYYVVLNKIQVLQYMYRYYVQKIIRIGATW